MRKWILVAVILIVGAANAQSGEITLATGEWVPYSSKAMDNHGFFSEIVTEICREMGTTAKFEFYPWRRCYVMVEKGQMMGAFPYTPTDERAKEVLFSESISESKTVFFHYGKKKIDDFTVLANLRPFKVGGIVGYFYEEAFEKAGLNADYAPDETSAIAKLMAGRTDVLALNEMVGWHIIKKNFPDKAGQFGTLSTPYDRNDLKLIVSKTYPGSAEFLKNFDAALTRVLSGEKYKAILKEYGLKE